MPSTATATRRSTANRARRGCWPSAWTTRRSARLSVDLGYQEHDLQGSRRLFSVGAGVTSTPAAPDGRINLFDPAEFSHPKVTYGMIRGEFDLGERWTAFG